MTVPSGAVRFLADEDFDNDVIRGLLRRMPEIDIVRIQDVGLCGADDADVLAWAAETGRIILTHDVSTMKTHAYARIAAGRRMPGLFAISQSVPAAVAIADILLIAHCSLLDEWEGQVRHLPL